jgi:hypothetical protein
MVVVLKEIVQHSIENLACNGLGVLIRIQRVGELAVRKRDDAGGLILRGTGFCGGPVRLKMAG